MHGVPRHTVSDRTARHVRRLRLRTSDTAARLTVQTILEEALRLTTLPGETRTRLPLPAAAALQRRLRTDPRNDRQLFEPSTVDGVGAFVRAGRGTRTPFSSDVQEPRPVARLLHAEAATEWFWSQATGIETSLPGDVQLEHALTGGVCSCGGRPLPAKCC